MLRIAGATCRNSVPIIQGWREVWKQGDFPFCFIQIASIGESPADQPASGDGRAEIRNAQFEALALPNTGMAVSVEVQPPNS